MKLAPSADFPKLLMSEMLKLWKLKDAFVQKDVGGR